MRTLAQNMAWLLKSVKAADRSNIKKLFMKNALQLISFLKYYRKAAGCCRFFFYVKTIKLHAILNAGSSIGMVIDIHTHTFPDKLAVTTIPKLQSTSHTRAYLDGTNTSLIKSMKQAGVHYSVVLPVATNPRQVVHINDRAARINDRFEMTGIFSFGCIHPDYEDYRKELARIEELGMKGIKLHPVYQGVDFNDIKTLRILDRAAELGLIVLTHSGFDTSFPGIVHVTPTMIRQVVQQIGPLTLIAAHMGGWHTWDEAEELLQDVPIFFDTSYSLGVLNPMNDGYYTSDELPLMNETQFVRMIRTFGAERFLFGTDSPWSDQQESVRRICQLPLQDSEKVAILGENAQRLLNFPNSSEF